VTLPRFIKSEENFQELRAILKLQTCPHCRRIGTLNSHGHLRGYPELGGGKGDEFRGRRLFCSNRRRRKPGCGRTVGLWFSNILPNFIIRLQTLWLFLTGILAGLAKADAFRRASSTQHPMSAYRIFRRMEDSQSRIRACLSRLVPPPEAPKSPAPLAATLAHLEAAFPHARCPPDAYQLHFQESFFRRKRVSFQHPVSRVPIERHQEFSRN